MTAPGRLTDRRLGLVSTRIGRKHAWGMGLLAFVTLGSFGVAELIVTARDARSSALDLQQRAAGDASRAIESALGIIDRQVEVVTALPWGVVPELDTDVRREEFGRLLRMVPAIESITQLDGANRSQLHLSRREIDQSAPGDPAPEHVPDPAQLPALLYSDGYEPVLALVVGYDERYSGGKTLVQIGLRALVDDVRAVLDRSDADTYVVDSSGRVVMHRDPDLMLQRHRVSLPAGLEHWIGVESVGVRGFAVVQTAVAMRRLPWFVVVDQPVSVVRAPVVEALVRSAVFLVGGLLAAITVALYLANRMTRPLVALHQGALAIARGNLSERIAVNTHDELEDLAHQFNRMAQALQDNVAQLEQRVAEKTADLAAANADMERVNAELKRANFALQLASQHKSEFLAHMSHELRTPLNAILGFADVLKDGMAGPMSDDQREYAADIHASGLHLLELINDVLDLARIEAGQIVLQPTAFSVREIVEATLAMVRQRCVRAGLALELSVAPEVATWVADPRRFKQVLLNLLFNAAKFTPSGGVRVCVAVDDQAGLVVAVLDTGVGIAPADHERIFDPFYQVRREGQPAIVAQEGTGLGLPLARQLVRQHGGELWFISRPGAGSGFFFNLPRSVG